jgi:transposase
MRELGVHRLIACCLNDACRHQTLIVSSYPAGTEVPYFRNKVVCAKCGSRRNKIDARPNWKEQPTRPTLLRYDCASPRVGLGEIAASNKNARRHQGDTLR